ncbi:unnamed protein product, partial [Didymodactylos carnosus]
LVMSLCEKCAKFYGLPDENNLCSFCFDPTRAEAKLHWTKRPQDPVEIKQRIDQLTLSTELFDLLKQFHPWRLEHLLCIYYVIDNWNIDQEVMHVDHCYCGSYYRPSTPEDIDILNFKQLKLHENVL